VELSGLQLLDYLWIIPLLFLKMATLIDKISRYLSGKRWVSELVNSWNKK
jgi:hypothetical protein